MTIHKHDSNMLKDEEFIPGELKLLVDGNKCRLLDGRRTPGVIEKYFEESAMFRWRITNFEDKGSFWDLPAEKITRFQFEKDSYRLDDYKLKAIKESINKLDVEMKINIKDEDRLRTEREILKSQENVKEWLKNNSIFFSHNQKIDFDNREGCDFLFRDLNNYMSSMGLDELEIKTAEALVLNPNSGEWIKGMSIVLAEMGLVPFKDKIPRTKDIFVGLGEKEKRRSYIINRLAFIRAYFNLLNIEEVVLYRGMSSEEEWSGITRTFLSCTFNLKVAESFSSFDRQSKYRTSYLIKTTLPVSKLFMTYLETKAMNKQYKEAEALVLLDKKICF